MNEEWRTITEFPDYDVSNLGQVRRNKTAPATRFRAGGILKPMIKRGYLVVALYLGCKPYMRYVHRLMLLAFAGLPPNANYQCNHRNGNKLDNRLENLEWVTPSENRLHALEVLGREKIRGERHGQAKLTEVAVRAIRADPRSQRILAREYGVTPSTISDIKRRLHWTHL